jgi:phosphate transport system protein
MQTLRDRVIALCEQVTEAVHSSAQAMIEQNEALARDVGAHDAQLNTQRFDIEEYAYALVSGHELSAFDVRRIVGVIMVTQALEQIGDYAANVAHLVVRMKRLECKTEPPEIFELLDEMAATAVDMTTDACRAFLDRDARRAEATVRRDQELVDAFDTINVALTRPSDLTGIPPECGQLLMWAAHNLHQIGTCAANICERAIFLATGELKEFH